VHGSQANEKFFSLQENGSSMPDKEAVTHRRRASFCGIQSGSALPLKALSGAGYGFLFQNDARAPRGGIKLPNSAGFPLPLCRTRYILLGYFMREMQHG
jgi:hypothetical protein